jgi:endonuclease/exonuclease/phosphatase family metal-dependent hydrolase
MQKRVSGFNLAPLQLIEIFSGGSAMSALTKLRVRQRCVALSSLVAAILAFSHLPTAAGDRDDVVRVMTRNIYQGADLIPLLQATTAQLPGAAAATYTSILTSTKPAERMAAIAREIAKYKIDLVGLEEVFILRNGPPQSPASPTFLPATTVVLDSLELLLAELAKCGEPYVVVATIPGFDAELPAINPPLAIDARLTVRDVIIARARSHMKLTNVQVQGYLTNRSFPSLSGITIPNPRGWAAVDVEKSGRKFRFAMTHLEQPDPVQRTQAHDMINGAGNTALPVIFVGDFNIRADAPADPTYAVYQQFIAAGFVDAWSRKFSTQPGVTCCQNPDLLNSTSLLNQRIDLVLFKGNLQVLDMIVVGDKQADRTPSGLWPSDHAGLAAALKLPNTRVASH